MSFGEYQDEDKTKNLLTDTKGKLIFLPNLELAKKEYERYISEIIKSGSLKSVLPDLLLDYTTRGIEEKQIMLGGNAYFASFDDGNGAGSIYLKPVEDLSQPKVWILPDQYGTGIRKVELRSGKQSSSGNPPLEVLSREMYIGNDLVREYKAVSLVIPKGQITFGVTEKEGKNFDRIRVSINEDVEEGATVTMSLGNPDTESGNGFDLPLIRLVQVQKSDLNAFGLDENQIDPMATYMESHESNTFTSVKPGTKQYDVTRSLAFAIAAEVTGKKMIDLTLIDQNSLVQDLFGPGISE